MNERKRSEVIDKWNAAHVTSATPKPRAGERVLKVAGEVQMKALSHDMGLIRRENERLRERERELVEALRELYQSVPAAQAPFPNDEMAPSAHWLAEEKTRALLTKHGR